MSMGSWKIIICVRRDSCQIHALLAQNRPPVDKGFRDGRWMLTKGLRTVSCRVSPSDTL